MRAIFTCLSFFVFTNLYAQDYARLQLGVSFGQNFDQVVYTGKKRHLMDEIKKSEKPVFGNSFGFNLIYNLNDRAGIEMGLLYAKRSFEMEGYKSILRESYQTIDLPLRVNYWLSRSRLSFVVGLGVNLSFVAKHQPSFHEDGDDDYTGIITYNHWKTNNPLVEVRQRDYTIATYNTVLGRTIQSTSYRKINLIPSLSVGANYNFSQNVAFRVESTLRYAVLSSATEGKFVSTVIDVNTSQSMRDDNFVSQNFWNVGISAGLYFTLKYDGGCWVLLRCPKAIPQTPRYLLTQHYDSPYLLFFINILG